MGLFRTFILLLLLSFQLSLPLSAQEFAFNSAQKDTVRSYLEAFPNGVQLAVGLVKGERRALYGLKKGKDGFRELSNADTVFRIGSLTKVFTATFLAKLISEGSLELQGSVWEELDLEPANDTTITFQQLAAHTSGLPRLPSNHSFLNFKNPYKGYDRKKLEEYITKKMELKSRPGDAFQYSNLGYGILGYALSRVADTSYEGLLQEYVAIPLGMKRTTTKRSKIGGALVQGLGRMGKPTPYWDMGALRGAGAIYSSVSDLLSYMAVQFDTTKQAYRLQQRVVHKVNERKSIGLGWHVLGQGKSRRYFHNGGTGGFRSSILLDLSEKKGVVVLSNISGSHERANELDKLSYILLKSF